MEVLFGVFFVPVLLLSVWAVKMPGSCKSGQYYDPGLMACQICPANSSMVSSIDGFGCTCQEHSIPLTASACKSCNATELLSTDGTTCVPRRCQVGGGKTVCRRCPGDFISVTQNHDGTPMKEVLCVKCGRGYRADNNKCVKCESCICAKHELAVLGKCLPKRYMNERPKYIENRLSAFLEVVKNEYLCSQNDHRACRYLANSCVINLYSTDLGGPCRLWIQPNSIRPKGLPTLTLDTTTNDKNPGDFTIETTKSLVIVVANHTSSGGMELFQDDRAASCMLPLTITLGSDVVHDCKMNISALEAISANSTLSPHIEINADFKPLPVIIQMTNGYNLQKGAWSTNKFNRYFLMDKFLNPVNNMTSTVYLRTLIIHVRLAKEKIRSAMRMQISIEAQYSTKSPLSQVITTTLKVEHDLPSAGIMRDLEIWGGVLGAFLPLYALAQWRGVLRRGGLQCTIVPLLAGCIADALYFASLFSTLQALMIASATHGLMLPLNQSEDQTIKAFVYSAVALKTIKLLWVNWSQCKCDIFFLDWSEYNTPEKGQTDESKNWRFATLAREWHRLQTIRKVQPWFTVTVALFALHFLTPWTNQANSYVYKWAISAIAWWSSYTGLLLVRILHGRFLTSPTKVLVETCTGVGMSLLVFQEENYAHYVHGRNDDASSKSMAAPLSMCRIVCAPQVRIIYKQLSMPGMGFSENKTLLCRFLAAFFERALDGLSWVASERTILERLLDVEITLREAGNTSTLLYDPDNKIPSCFNLTWWGEEWSMSTFDAMMFGCICISTGNSQLGSFVVLLIWQIMKNTRSWYGYKKLREKLNV